MFSFSKLLTTPTSQLGRAGRFLVFQIKLWSHCARLLRKNRAGQQAAALSYHTIFGIVPLVIVTLLIFQSLPHYSDLGEKIKIIAYEQFHLTTIEYPDPQDPDRNIMLTEYLDGIISGFFRGVNTGSITIISTIITIWAALSLLSTIEAAFNNIWHVTRARNFVQRIINYWAVLTLGPLLLGVLIYITTQYATLGRIQQTVLSSVAPVVLSYLVSAAGFFLLYFVLPNTRVQARAALWGALMAALVWTIAKWFFGECIVRFIPYGKVYGVLGLVPLSVLWVFITWLIGLFGLQLTFTTQHLQSLDAAQIAAAKKTEEHFIANDLTIINILRNIATASEKNSAPVEAQVLCSKLSIPAEFADKLLNHLVGSGLIVRTSDPKVGFVLTKDPAAIKLSDITDAVAAAGFTQSTSDQPQMLSRIAQTQHEALAQYTLKQILDLDQNSPAHQPQEPQQDSINT